jgi:hypothetical protein
MIFHPTLKTLSRFVDGGLSDAQLHKIRNHLAGCQPCNQKLQTLQQMEPALTPKRHLPSTFKTRIVSNLKDMKRVKAPACAEVKNIRGTALIFRNGEEQGIAAFPGMSLMNGDRLRLIGTSLALIELNDGSSLYLNKETEIQFPTTDYPLALSIGELFATMKPQKEVFEIRTPSAVLGVIGTDFDAKVTEKKETVLHVLKGKVSFKNESGSTVVKKKRQVEATTNAKPVPQKIKETRSIYNWTLPMKPRKNERGWVTKKLYLLVLPILAILIFVGGYLAYQRYVAYELPTDYAPSAKSSSPDTSGESPKTASALEFASPYMQKGLTWRTRVTEQLQRDNSWIDLSTLVIRSDIIRVDETNGATVLLTIEDDKISKENPDAKDWANETAAKMIGRRFEYSVSPEGAAHSTRVADGKPLEHLEILIFSLARAYSDLTGLYLKKSLMPGDQWTEQYEDKIPGYPNSYVKGAATYQFVNYEVRNGVEYAVIRAEGATSLGGGIPIQRTIASKVTRDFLLDDVRFDQKGEYLIDVRSGRVVSGTYTYKFGAMKSTVITYAEGRNVPVTEKVEKGSGGTTRAFLTLEYLP